MKKLANILKNRALQTSAVVGVATLSVGSAMAQENAQVEFIDIGVDAGTIASTIGTTIGPWVLGAFGIAGSATSRTAVDKTKGGDRCATS